MWQVESSIIINVTGWLDKLIEAKEIAQKPDVKLTLVRRAINGTEDRVFKRGKLPTVEVTKCVRLLVLEYAKLKGVTLKGAKLKDVKLKGQVKARNKLEN